MKIIKTFGNKEDREYSERISVRAVVANNDKVIILHSKKNKFYELPGGGVDNSESLENAVLREVLEETGYISEIAEEVGSIQEYINEIDLYKVTYCFLCTILDQDNRKPTLSDPEDNEKENIQTSLANAIELISTSEISNNPIAKYSKERDICFLGVLNKVHF